MEQSLIEVKGEEQAIARLRPDLSKSAGFTKQF
jgi:hypothetical protein